MISNAPAPSTNPSNSPKIGRALLIGVTNYGLRTHRDGLREYSDLKDGDVEFPFEDINTVGSFLEDHGFTIQTEHDLKSVEITSKIKKFAKEIRPKEVVWIYLAGHADYFGDPDENDPNTLWNQYGFIGLDCREVLIFKLLKKIWPREDDRPTLIVTLDTCFRLYNVSGRSANPPPLQSTLAPNIKNPITPKQPFEDSQKDTLMLPFLSEWKRALVVFNRKANSANGLSSDFSKDFVYRLRGFTEQIEKLDINGRVNIEMLVKLLAEDRYSVIPEVTTEDFKNLKNKDAFSYNTLRILKDLLSSNNLTHETQQEISSFVARVIHNQERSKSIDSKTYEQLLLIKRICNIFEPRCAMAMKLIEQFENDLKQDIVTKEASEVFLGKINQVLDDKKDDEGHLLLRYRLIARYFILKQNFDAYLGTAPRERSVVLQLTESIKTLNTLLKDGKIFDHDLLITLPVDESMRERVRNCLDDIMCELDSVLLSVDELSETYQHIENLYKILDGDHSLGMRIARRFNLFSKNTYQRFRALSLPFTTWELWATGLFLLVVVLFVLAWYPGGAIISVRMLSLLLTLFVLIYILGVTISLSVYYRTYVILSFRRTGLGFLVGVIIAGSAILGLDLALIAPGWALVLVTIICGVVGSFVVSSSLYDSL